MSLNRTYHCARCTLASVAPVPCVNLCVLFSTNRRGAHLPSRLVYQSRDVHAFKWFYTDVVSYSKPFSRIIDVEHELLVRYLSGTEVRSLEDLERDRSISSEIPAVNQCAPAERRVEDRWVCWVEFKLRKVNEFPHLGMERRVELT